MECWTCGDRINEGERHIRMQFIRGPSGGICEFLFDKLTCFNSWAIISVQAEISAITEAEERRPDASQN